MPSGNSRGEIGTEKESHDSITAAERTIGTEPSQEVRLFHSLNQFIELVSNEANRDGTKDRLKVGSDKHVSNFLRLNLLSHLRQLQQYPGRCDGYREVLVQWWVTLLNFLNSDLIPDETGSRTSSTHFLSFPDPLLSIETVSVCLECVSRLMSSLMVLPTHHVQQTEIYSHHILLTIHYVTNRLILNAKHSRQSTSDPSNRAFLHFLNSYSSLLRSFLGKLNAYAFFYLPDEFHYDTQALLTITPDVIFQHNQCGTAFGWKKRSFSTTKDTNSRLDPRDLDTRDTKFFKIVVSYLKNNSVLMAFYWHYWYIVLRFTSKCESSNDGVLDMNLLPGASVLLEHVTYSFLRNDLNRFIKFIRSTNTSKGSNINVFNASDTMPDSSAATTEMFMTNEMLNEFVFTNFSILRLWECLRSLAGCFQNDSSMNNLLQLHDSSQLKYVTEVPAYDYNIANVIYNKILQFVVFQFDSYRSANFLNWDIWCQGAVSMLHTLNGSCQVVALLCLFNIWNHLPAEVQRYVTSELLSDLWSSLTVECDFQLSKILFFKLLVFRVTPSADLSSKELLKKRLQDMSDEMLFLDDELDDVNRSRKRDVLLFYGNRKFFLLPNKPREEEGIIFRAERESKANTKRNHPNFPTVVSAANIRPSLILKGGKYPYDVFDEMVVKAALLLAEKKRKDSEAPLPTVENPSSSSAHEPSSVENDRSKTSPSISSALGSWFSKLSTNTDSRIKKLGSSPRRNSVRSSNSEVDKSSLQRGDVSLGSCRSTDMLSMYSTVSSLATGRTNPSDERLGNTDRGTSDHVSKGFGKANSMSEKLRTDLHKKKKKLLSPVELKYTSSITEQTTITTLFKALNVPCESILAKIEKANANWSVITARTYDKPLPISADTAVETVIEGMRSQSLHSLEEADVELDQLQTPGKVSNDSTLLSSFSDNSFLPRPDYSILGLVSGNTLTSDSELAARIQKFTLNRDWSGNPPSLNSDNSSNAQGHENARDLETLSQNKKMHLETRILKLSTLLRMFNHTVGEYYEHLNFMNHSSIFLEFEIKPHFASQNTPEQSKRSI